MSQLILTFHGVGLPAGELSGGELDCWITSAMFEAVLDLVQDCDDVRLTFDDGNRSDVDVALPALLRRGLVATFFICAGRLEEPDYVGDDDVRRLVGHGMEIGSHGFSHRPWRRLSPRELGEDVSRSRRLLEEVSGASVNSTACPFGAYDARVLRSIREAGYRHVFTSDGGWATAGAWIQPRNTLRRFMTLEDVTRLVRRPPGRLVRIRDRLRRELKGRR